MSGGQERYILRVANGLLQRGHKVALVFGKTDGEDTDVSLAQFETVLIKDLDVDGTLKYANQFGADVVNLQNVYDSKLIKALRAQYPVTRFVHDHATYCPGNSKYFFNSKKICPIATSGLCLLYAYREKCMTRRLPLAISRVRQRQNWLAALKTLPLVFCNSRFVKERLVQNGLGGSKIVVNNLFPGHGGAGGTHNEVSPANAEKVILFVGRLFKEKGVDLLIKAVSKIKVPVRLKIVGEGWEKNRLECLARDLSIGDRVNFLGFKGGRELVELYASCDIFAMPSVWPEPFGMVGLEAAQFGKPVIAFNVGGISDWLIDGVNGILLPQADVGLLAESLSKLLGNSQLCQKLGQNGWEIVNSKFSLAKHLDVLEQSYAKILK